jgi:rsbT antagonist protein RsbS
MKSRAIPIVRLRDSLIVSIQIELSDHLVLALKDDVGAEIVARPTRGLVIEISGVDIFDSFIAGSIRDLAHLARLMGVDTVVAGLDPAMAITLVEMGMDMRGIRTALNLDAALRLLEAERRGEAAGDAQLLESIEGPGAEAPASGVGGAGGGRE